ncbi:hypothetical protein [Polymorphospora rubra]|uniref:Uncharacterized protein n=1 Tax=Polymorphospora rubra TaxID=338584 RepID=A0A810NCF1_9ACTN|nr:hypothetical protein [Polymorphospora rubra]BCJ69759.1 hypothetical protein Prubr_67800 [Polymorphospora rubra]
MADTSNELPEFLGQSDTVLVLEAQDLLLGEYGVENGPFSRGQGRKFGLNPGEPVVHQCFFTRQR